MNPAGLSGSKARSASLRLRRYSASFHARTMLKRDIAFSFSCLNGRRNRRLSCRNPYPLELAMHPVRVFDGGVSFLGAITSPDRTQVLVRQFDEPRRVGRQQGLFGVGQAL